MSTRKPASRPPTRPAKSGTPATAAQRRLAAQRAAAAAARGKSTQRQRQRTAVLTSIAVVLVLVGTLVVVKLATGGGPASGTKSTALPAAIAADIAGVPSATFDAVGAGSIKTPPSAIDAPALTADGKPLVFYAGAEYCPYCAAERWAVAVALSRFGTFTGLSQTASSPSDVFPSTATISFHGATYTSDYLTLQAKELQSNQVTDGRYAELDTLTATQQELMSKYDAPPYTDTTGSIPFVDLAGRYVISGASYSPGVLKGKSHSDIAAALAEPDSSVAKAIVGTANTITAALCDATGGKPAAVCTSNGVRAAATELGSGG